MNAEEKKVSKRIDAIEADIASIDAIIAGLYNQLEYYLTFIAYEQQWLYDHKPDEFSTSYVTITDNCELP